MNKVAYTNRNYSRESLDMYHVSLLAVSLKTPYEILFNNPKGASNVENAVH